MRQFINKYGAYIAAGAVVLTAILIYALGPFRGNPSVPTRAFYIDEATGEESIQPIASIPPLPGKDGKPTLVQVVKVSCDGGKNPRTVYYRKYAPQAKQKIEELRGTNDATKQTEMDDWMSRGEMLRDPAPGSPWVYALSDAGEKLREKALCTNGQIARVVYPP